MVETAKKLLHGLIRMEEEKMLLTRHKKELGNIPVRIQRFLPKIEWFADFYSPCTLSLSLSLSLLKYTSERERERTRTHTRERNSSTEKERERGEKSCSIRV